MRTLERPTVSVVFPVYDEEGNLESLYRQVHEALSRVDAEYDMVFVDNGSTDSSLEIIKGLSRRDSRVGSRTADVQGSDTE